MYLLNKGVICTFVVIIFITVHSGWE